MRRVAEGTAGGSEVPAAGCGGRSPSAHSSKQPGSESPKGDELAKGHGIQRKATSRFEVFFLLILFLVVACFGARIYLQVLNEPLRAGPDDWRPHFAAQAGEHKAKRRIPWQLVLTAKEESIESMPPNIQENFKRTLALSPGVRVRWLGDAACRQYIQEHFDAELLGMFDAEIRGSFRGDICRACVLSREGGYYLDLDMQLRMPLDDLADNATTFVSALTEDHAVLNAILAAEPGHEVLREVLAQIRAWYNFAVPHTDESTSSEWMGPVTMLRALQAVVDRNCKGRQLRVADTLQWTCGNQSLRLYQEMTLDCSLRGSPECPPKRADAEFNGVRFGIFVPGPERILVAWPRFESCADWGCHAGGWDEGPSGADQLANKGKAAGSILAWLTGSSFPDGIKDAQGDIGLPATATLHRKEQVPLVVSFLPGEIGMQIQHDSGHVAQLTEGGQAAGLGVEVGMRFESLDGQPYSWELMKQKLDDKQPVTATFVRDQRYSSEDGEELYLPKSVKGAEVLVRIGEDKWRVDDTTLRSGAAGVAYRRSKDLKDTSGMSVKFGQEVDGFDDGDWVKVSLKALG